MRTFRFDVLCQLNCLRQAARAAKGDASHVVRWKTKGGFWFTRRFVIACQQTFLES
ncbi:hypothetical protein Thiowin_02370 [Thiorhodovibrio winogradskyi]|uniref:Uncharacterized protein n=1 Tax=Thiorhodovibrio winogradskyi TaxID=77007 RepID=A0ABZ0S8J3_9GAMM